MNLTLNVNSRVFVKHCISLVRCQFSVNLDAECELLVSMGFCNCIMQCVRHLRVTRFSLAHALNASEKSIIHAIVFGWVQVEQLAASLEHTPETPHITFNVILLLLLARTQNNSLLSFSLNLFFLETPSSLEKANTRSKETLTSEI